jgi:hypothetical protein
MVDMLDTLVRFVAENIAKGDDSTRALYYAESLFSGASEVLDAEQIAQDEREAA